MNEEYQRSKILTFKKLATTLATFYATSFILTATPVKLWLAHLPVSPLQQEALASFNDIHGSMANLGLHKPWENLRTTFRTEALGTNDSEIGFQMAEKAIAAPLPPPPEPYQPFFQPGSVRLAGLDLKLKKPEQILTDDLMLVTNRSFQKSVYQHAKDMADIRQKNHYGKVLILGDSLMGGISPFLKKHIRLQDPKNHPKIKWVQSSGLVRDNFFHWPKAIDALVKGQAYDHTIVLFGANDPQKPLKVAGKWLRYGEKEWDEAYVEKVEAIVDNICNHSKKLFWVLMPPMRSKSFHKDTRHLNSLYQKAVLKRPICAETIAIGEVIGKEADTYSTYHLLDGRQRKMRASDGIHFTPRASERVAKHILSQIEEQARPLSFAH